MGVIIVTAEATTRRKGHTEMMGKLYDRKGREEMKNDLSTLFSKKRLG